MVSVFPAMLLFLLAGAPGETRVRLKRFEATGVAVSAERIDRHLAIQLRQAGFTLVHSPKAEIALTARCHGEGASNAMRCTIHVRRQKRQQKFLASIPSQNADDFCDSLSLLIATILRTDVSGAAGKPAVVPAESPPPAPPEQAIDAGTRGGSAQAPVISEPPAPAPPNVEPAPPARLPEPETEPLVSSRKRIELGASLAFDLGFNAPPTYGLLARAHYARNSLRLGVIALGQAASRSVAGYQLSFTRVLCGAMVGSGADWDPWSFDYLAGPAIIYLSTEASAVGARHSLYSPALVGTVQLTRRIGNHFGAFVSLDVAGVLTRQAIAANGRNITGFSWALMAPGIGAAIDW